MQRVVCSMEKEKIKSFTDLDAWKEGNSLVLKIYKITQHFPKEEVFGLTNQIRRAAISITSNIAEGFNRASGKEKIQFYFISLGSLAESQNQLYIAKQLSYIEADEFNKIAEQTVIVSKLLNGLIKSIKHLS